MHLLKTALAAAGLLLAAALPAAAQCIEHGGYPWTDPDSCLVKADLNKALGFSRGSTVPANADGTGALQGYWWDDTSVSPETMRVCKVSQCTGTSYNAGEWGLVGTFVGGAFNLSIAQLSATISAPLQLGGTTLSLLYDSNFTVNGSNQLALTSCTAGQVLGNSASSSAEPGCAALSALLDRALGSTPGTFALRGAGSWGAVALSGDFSCNSSGVCTIGANAVGNSKLAQGTGPVVKCVTSGTANFADCTPSQIDTMTEQGLTLISVTTISSLSTYTDTSSISSACDDYVIDISDLIPTTNNVNPEMLVHSNGSFQSSSYVNAAGGVTTYFDLTSSGGNFGSTDGGDFLIYLFGVNSSVHKKLRSVGAYLTNTPTAVNSNAAAAWTGGTTAIDGFEILMSSGNIASGKVRVYCRRPAM